jgi:hypothetical protein
VSSQAEAGAVRWLTLGAVLGLLASGLLVGAWHRDARGLSVTVLGAGRQASVLITSHHRRILIAAGTNGASFSNALADALPPVDKQLDVLLIDPSASLDVRDRARALQARVVWTLPDADEPTVADTVERSFSIEFDDETSLRFIVRDDGAWLAILTSSAGPVVIAPRVESMASENSQAAVAILTHEHTDAAFDVPLLIVLPGIATGADQQLRVARPGTTVRLDIGDDAIRAEAA